MVKAGGCEPPTREFDPHHLPHMKLILRYVVPGGWESNSFAVVLPIEYESEEALICDFEEALDKAVVEKKYSFIFGSEEFYIDAFYFNDSEIMFPFKNKVNVINKILPEIFTVESWFEKNNICP